MGATAEMLAAAAKNRVEAEDWAMDLVRDIGIPLRWQVFQSPTLHYRKLGDNLLVMWSARKESDGRRWVHVSCSRPSKLPSWEDLREVKDTFIGRDRRALQVLPPAAEYINIHPHCLHLWSCLDGEPVPDFRIAGMI